MLDIRPGAHRIHVALVCLAFAGCSDHTAHIPPDNFGIYAVPAGETWSEGQAVPSGARPEFTGTDIQEIWESVDPMTGTLQFEFKFTQTAKERFADFTEAHAGNMIAIVVTGRVLSVPRVIERIPGGQAAIIVQDPSEMPALRNALHIAP